MEVGEFFNELIDSKALDLKTLPYVGFEFLAQYWISVNMNNSKVLKIEKEAKKESTWSYWKKQNEADDVEEDKADDPLFSVLIDPDQLEKTEIIEQIVLESEISEVYTAAIKFYIYTHMSLDEGLSEDRSTITQQLIKKCFGLLEIENPSP